MRKPGKCRSCNLNYELTNKVGRHQIVNADIYCLICKSSGKSAYHGSHEDLSGDSLECNNCHNYILYTIGMGTIWKDEIYLPNNSCLIRDLEESKSHFIFNDVAWDSGKFYSIEIPGILQFSSIENLISKLEILSIFS